jgi:hypothetical protein
MIVSISPRALETNANSISCHIKDGMPSSVLNDD